ncbi:galectin-7-like [Balaenoptera ricei]|uniref:galectin-7-like n=1 Tax=Balaenoptera ricei TaxID=2746895 RepID=UPI0028BD68C7|nr:galectin-7-like [Balaenoptera ricei]
MGGRLSGQRERRWAWRVRAASGLQPGSPPAPAPAAGRLSPAPPSWAAVAGALAPALLLLQNVPYKTSLPDGFEVGTVMLVRGVVPRGADRFYINLLCSEEPKSETVLHFNPRLDESTVVFNTLKCGEWGPEERGLGIPFQRGQRFYLLLLASKRGFKVVVADSEYHHFVYRLPPERARLLEIGGDVQLELVEIF